MPELPEVETVCRGLATAVEGKRIVAVEPRREGLRFPFPKDMAAQLEGATMQTVSRRAKYIVTALDNRKILLMHLGMSGKILVYPAKRNDIQKHDHLIFTLDDGQEVVFNDPRRFGIVDICEADNLNQHPLLTSLGVEPLSDAFTPAYLYDRFKGKKAPIKNRLMDSHMVVGVGNIYASESLFRAGITPERQVGKVTKKECETLVPIIQQVLQEAIESGGSTLRDYVRSSGDVGYFQHNFRVYGKEKEPCSACVTPIQRIVQAGRASFFCPTCQK